jgi:hypothetical protein
MYIKLSSHHRQPFCVVYYFSKTFNLTIMVMSQLKFIIKLLGVNSDLFSNSLINVSGLK